MSSTFWRHRLETPLDGPLFFAIGPECVERAPLMVSERLQCPVEGEQVTADDLDIQLTGTHSPTLPPSTLVLWAASIFRSWGT